MFLNIHYQRAGGTPLCMSGVYADVCGVNAIRYRF